MSETMDKIYDMITEEVDERCAQNREVKMLLRRKCALVDKIIVRIGADGDELMDGLTDLSAELETIHDKALFRAGVRLGVELTRPEAGAVTAAGP